MSTIYVRDPFREFDTLVRRAFGPQALEPTAGFSPAAESFREGDDAVIRLEIPGVDVARDVDVEVVGRQLVISGERRDERPEEVTGRRLRELRYGAFKRAFRLGSGVSADAVSASYDAGVLTVRVAGAYAATAGQKIAIATPAIGVPVVEGEGVDEA